MLSLSPAIYRAQNPETPKSLQKSLPRGLWDPPGPPKGSPKSPKSPQKIVKINNFLDFSDFFWNFFGGPGGSQRPLGRLFWRLLGVLGSVDGRGDPNSRCCRPLLRRPLIFFQETAAMCRPGACFFLVLPLLLF